MNILTDCQVCVIIVSDQQDNGRDEKHNKNECLSEGIHRIHFVNGHSQRDGDAESIPMS